MRDCFLNLCCLGAICHGRLLVTATVIPIAPKAPVRCLHAVPRKLVEFVMQFCIPRANGHSRAWIDAEDVCAKRPGQTEIDYIFLPGTRLHFRQLRGLEIFAFMSSDIEDGDLLTRVALPI